ncbi:organ-specific protein P4 [Juglans microcarpa x Juglans regia]|uniref:organ-specific protein P4 n=1 Tax=Juglans microcarpa x Juglans regia TaxID=2249226 RepID=UPI001B7E7BF3|nr:organ-specific protein P4 [Juglans microcarpa x Juglans regia]
MKSISAFLLLFSLFLLVLVNLSDARRDPGDYWKSIMKDQPIPEAIKGLLHRDLPYASDARENVHFLKDFDVTPNAIIYHAHVEDKEEKKPAFVEDFEQKSHTELNLF